MVIQFIIIKLIACYYLKFIIPFLFSLLKLNSPLMDLSNNLQYYHHPRIKISVNTDILVLGFYEYIENIGEISVDILTKISMRRKLFKIHKNT